MNIPFSFDRTGFPLLHLIDLGCYVHMLPVTKAQFSEYAKEHEYTQTIFEAASGTNPLDREKPASTIRLEQHLMTGILPDEAEHFAAWIGQAEDENARLKLPTVSEWREIYNAFQYELVQPLAGHICEACPNPLARDLIQLILETRTPHTLQDLSLMRGGVVEWVDAKGNWQGLGCPDPSFFPNTFEPLRDTFDPIDPERRMREFGFRVMRTFK